MVNHVVQEQVPLSILKDFVEKQQQIIIVMSFDPSVISAADVVRVVEARVDASMVGVGKGFSLTNW